MYNEINKKNFRMKETIRLPFDGTAKCGNEIAKMVGETLLTRHEEKVEIVFPGQWAMTPAHMMHPECGVLALLDKDAAINAIYQFTGFSRNGTIGVIATRCC